MCSLLHAVYLFLAEVDGDSGIEELGLGRPQARDEVIRRQRLEGGRRRVAGRERGREGEREGGETGNKVESERKGERGREKVMEQEEL